MTAAAGRLDPEQLAMLRELDDGDGELLDMMASEFEQDGYAQLAVLADAIDQRDAGGVQRAAHRIKGASANLGASGLTDLCAQLEQAGRDDQLDAAAALLDAASVELEVVCVEFRRAVAEA